MDSLIDDVDAKKKGARYFLGAEAADDVGGSFRSRVAPRPFP
jgi:hypothetical protein